MCLYRLKDNIQLKKERWHNVGWKIFLKKHGHLYGLHKGVRRYKCNTWLKEEKHRDSCVRGIRALSGEMYAVGFHIYIEYPNIYYDMSNEEIRKVYYRKIIAKGTDSNIPTIVAKEMFIPYLKDYK